MSTSSSTCFVFTDLETGGLDEKKDPILEIAWAITDDEFTVIREPQVHVIAQDDWLSFFNYWEQSVDPVVKKMHLENGLFEEIQKDGASNLDRAFLALEKDLLSLPIGTRAQMAGRGVHFDRAFLLENDFDSLWDERRENGPLIDYRIFDLRSIRTFFELRGISVPVAYPKVQHRAMTDVMSDIDFAKSAVELLESAFPHPPVRVESTPYMQVS